MLHSLLILIPLFLMMLLAPNLLYALLSIEMASLSLIFLALTFSISSSPPNIITLLILLTLGACEASIALACLVITTNSYGHDQMSNLTTLAN